MIHVKSSINCTNMQKLYRINYGFSKLYLPISFYFC